MANFEAPTAEWLTVRLWCPTCRGRWVEVRAVGERPRRFWKRTAAPVPA